MKFGKHANSTTEDTFYHDNYDPFKQFCQYGASIRSEDNVWNKALVQYLIYQYHRRGWNLKYPDTCTACFLDGASVRGVGQEFHQYIGWILYY